MMQKGFTLIELMIVVGIIGILAAIAIPQFTAYRIRAFNTAAQSDLRNGVTAEEAYYSTVFHYFSIDMPATSTGTQNAQLALKTSQNVALHLTAMAATDDYFGISWNTQGDRSYRITGSFGRIR